MAAREEGKEGSEEEGGTDLDIEDEIPKIQLGELH